MLYHHTVVVKEWHDVAWDVLCLTTFSWRHSIRMWEKRYKCNVSYQLFYNISVLYMILYPNVHMESICPPEKCVCCSLYFTHLYCLLLSNVSISYRYVFSNFSAGLWEPEFLWTSQTSVNSCWPVILCNENHPTLYSERGCRGRDHIDVGFTTTCAITPNRYLSPLKLWVQTSFMARCTRYNIMW